MLALYSSPSAQVYTLSALSKPFTINNGTRQGCPLPSLIFNLTIEPLVQSIRLSSNIKGRKIGNKEHKIGLLADDLILAITYPESSIKALSARFRITK